MLHIINKRRIWYVFSGILIVLSLFGFFSRGLNLGIDFTGGSLLEISFIKERPAVTEFRDSLQSLELENLQVSETGDKGFILRFQSVSEDRHQDILNHIKTKFPTKLTQEEANEYLKEEKGVTLEVGDLGIETEEGSVAPKVELELVNSEIDAFVEERFDSIGPVIGEELKTKALYSLLVVLGAIILYVAWAFRKVSKPVSSFHYGLITVITLFHDIIITVGVFVLLGMILGLEVNTPFVAALLTILGYSVNDTIVVFDRIRENLQNRSDNFADLVDMSVKQTAIRSINTSMTTLLALIAVYFFGGATLQAFVLALIVGIILGTYSSIFIASPLLVTLLALKKRQK